jgi:hypothetical protein
MHGILFLVRPNAGSAPLLRSLAPRDELPGREWRWDDTRSLEDAVDEVLRWRPGPAANADVNIDIQSELPISLDVEQETLLRRAFSDAAQVTLRPLSGGYSGSTFRVDMVSNDPHASRPLPFVIKFDKPRKIALEFKAYWQHVNPAVPFHLRPMLDANRSMIGRRWGVLVSTFITGSEPLADAAARGHAQLALYSLFDHATAVWHANAQCVQGNLVDALSNCLSVNAAFAGSAQAQAWAADGDNVDAPSLIQALRAKAPTTYLAGTTHGDLHAHNVHVRSGDAILMDFYACGVRSPALYDAAYLEVRTAFCRETHDSLRDEWETAVTELYRKEAVSTVPPAILEPRRSRWLRNFVRQVRLFVVPMSPAHEYSVLVAWALIRHATFQPPGDQHSVERRHALRVAFQLVAAL